MPWHCEHPPLGGAVQSLLGTAERWMRWLHDDVHPQVIDSGDLCRDSTMMVTVP
jgi:hypothetical protein